MLEKVWRKENVLALLGEYKLTQPLWKMVWRFLKKLGIKPPHDPAIPLLGVYPEEIKIEKYTCIPMFTAALFTIARTWKQLRCPSIDEWIKKLWCIYTMEYKSAIKKECIWVNSKEVNEPKTYYTKWSKSERERYILYTNTYIWNLERWYDEIYLQGSSGETDTENRLMDMGRGEDRVRCVERVTWKLTSPCVK